MLLLLDDDDERITACDSTLGSPFCPFSPSLPGSPASPWSHRSSQRCNTAITLIAVCCSSCFYMPILRVVLVGGSRGTSPSLDLTFPPTGLSENLGEWKGGGEGNAKGKGGGDHLPYSPPLASASNATLPILMDRLESLYEVQPKVKAERLTL